MEIRACGYENWNSPTKIQRHGRRVATCNWAHPQKNDQELRMKEKLWLYIRLVVITTGANRFENQAH
jgi:hypothetical protein